MKYVSVSEMKELDRRAIEDHGIPALRLMENAGKALADEAMKMAGKGRVAVFAGYGNNGGDGLVSARHFVKNGYSVTVFFVGKPRSFTRESNANLERILSLGVKPQFITKKEDIARISFGPSTKAQGQSRAVRQAHSASNGAEQGQGTNSGPRTGIRRGIDGGKPDIVIDAIFGIGIKGPIDEFYAALIEKINGLGVPIISADVPSGLDADTGELAGSAIKAVKTVTFGFPKIGFKNPEAKRYIGDLIIADIGIPKNIEKEVDNRALHVSGSLPQRKVIRLRMGKRGILKAGHPWIYKGQIREVNRSVKPGDIITVLKADGSFIGRGYYNPKSDISIRLLSFKDEVVDKRFFEERIRMAAEKRRALLKTTNAYRAVFSEADGLPGLILDIYNDTAVFQVLTLGMERVKETVIEVIREALSPKYIYEKSVSPFRTLEGIEKMSMWRGEKREGVIEIFEDRAKFLVDIENGHKTGFYLDQRRSRQAMAGISKGKKVLDLFCYTGGFSINAALCGASSVRGVDIKREWLDTALKNAHLNGVSERLEFIKGDAFQILRNIYASNEKSDIIVIDPPSFIKRKGSLKHALRGYKDLNLMAMKTLNEGGVLCTFSCSHNMPNEAFSDILKSASRDAGKRFTILKRCHQAEDHPVVKYIPETEYLKGYFLKINSA